MSLEEYIEFINEPKHLINPVRSIIILDNPFFEMLTKTPWFFIPIGWAPMLVYYACQSELSMLATILMIALGLGIWSFIEYALHRFLFHGEDYWLPDNPKMLAFHFFIHGIHHAFPMDQYRLVLPLLAGYFAHSLVVITPVKFLVPE